MNPDTFRARPGRASRRAARSAGLVLFAWAASAQAAMDCSALVGVTTDDATMTSAAVLNPGPVPGGNVSVTVPM